MSRYYWRCGLCGSEAEDTTRHGVELFAMHHICNPARRSEQRLVRPRRQPQLTIARLASGRHPNA